MRTGRSMLSSISSKSLITGNVKIEESRKEIRNSPGAPSAPAKATIFCFQPLRGAVNEESSARVFVQCTRRRQRHWPGVVTSCCLSGADSQRKLSGDDPMRIVEGLQLLNFARRYS